MPAKTPPATPAPAATQFPGFRPAALAFFRDLTVSNEKAWFQANKPTYETEVLRPMTLLVPEVVAELARRKVPLTGDVKKSLFRVNRDVRFSNNKSPYKTHAGAVWSRDGVKMTPGVLYFHFDPEGSFVAAGFYVPEPPLLAKLRDAQVRRTDDFLAAVASLAGHGLTLSREDALKRTPRGFEEYADGPLAEHLKLKSLIVSRPLAVKDLRGPALGAKLADFAADALPLLTFGWAALDTPA